jgi:tripartite-type tricarboxylate transporter receptor subunit TctC
MKLLLNLCRRCVLLTVAAIAALGLAPVAAQTFPTKPIRIIVPFGAGGVADITARAVGQKLGEQVGQAVVIENRPGAGGILAGETVARADADGHTLLLMSNGTAVSVGLFRKLPFDPIKDFVSVSTLGFFDIAVVSNVARFASVTELLAFARANPGKLNIGTINIGSTQNLAAELFKTSAGIDAQIVPFNGTPAVLTALRSGEIDVAVEIVAPVLGQIASGAVRGLAVMGEQRNAALKDVPTLRESGLVNFNVASWNALAAPAGTPAAVVARLNKEIGVALASPDLRKRLADAGVEARASSSPQMSDLLASEIKRWSDVIERARIAKQ